MSKIYHSLAEVREGIRLALWAVRSNKFRSAMTIIGVMIGVGAVIVINTILDGFNGYVELSIDRIGKDVIYVTKWEEGTDFESLSEEERRRKNITMDEAYAIQEMCPMVEAVAPEKSVFTDIVKYGNRSMRVGNDFRGCWPSMALVTNRDVSHGRFLDGNDLSRSAMVCVIGSEVADVLFDSYAEAIGEEIRVDAHRYRVVGVLEEVEDLFDITEDDNIFIPLTTFEQLYPDVERVYLLCSATSRHTFPEALDQVINALRRVRKLRPEEDNNFGILTQERFKDEINGITGKVQLGATAVASVGLMVGVIGVMNIMLVAVTQRTREIGLRKAVGARKANIIFQFLVEAGTLTGLGGIIGIIFGALVGLAVTTGLDWHYSLSPFWIFFGLAMSVGTGVAAGLYPAWRAARVDPIIALHYE